LYPVSITSLVPADVPLGTEVPHLFEVQTDHSHRSTFTAVPTGRVVSGGTSSKPLAAASELSTWLAWTPAEETFPSGSILTREKCRREPRLLITSAKVPGWAGSEMSWKPCHRNKAGRTNSRKVTNAETGLPGRPNRNFPA